MEVGMRQILGFSAGCLGFIALVLLIVWAMGGFAGGELGFHGWVALTLGIVLTCALAITLMALVFHSARSGRDESAGGGGHKPDG
jgi:hypothetical protein